MYSSRYQGRLVIFLPGGKKFSDVKVTHLWVLSGYLTNNKRP